MEIAITPAYHQQEFPMEISAVKRFECLMVEWCSDSDFDMDGYFSPWLPPVTSPWLPPVTGSEFIRTGTVKKSMDPSLSIQKKNMQYNGRVVVFEKIDALHRGGYMLNGNLGKYLPDELDRQTILNAIRTTANGFLRLLKRRFYHLDLKPANMLLYYCNMVANMLVDSCNMVANMFPDCNMVAKITDIDFPMFLSDELLDRQTYLNAIRTIANGFPCRQLKPRIYRLDLKPANMFRDYCNMVEEESLAFFRNMWDIVTRSVPSLGTGGIVRYNRFCYEYMQNGNLDEYHGLYWPTCLNIVKSIRTGRAYLHERFCHIDLKPANVLLDESMMPKIADKHWYGIPPSCFGEEARKMRSCGFGNDDGGGSRFGEEARKMSSTGLAYLMLLLMIAEAVFAIVYQNWRGRWKFESSSKQTGGAATNSSDETTRTPMANNLTDDEAENHSDPNSCVAERDTIEEEKRSGEWYVATGAAHHATWNRDLFSYLVGVENDGLCVHAADGTSMPVCGRGDVVTDDVVLPDVYYVPRLCTNLVSVGQLAGLDYCVGFGRGACVISSAAGTVVGRAHARGDGLYEVDFLRVPLGMP